jgi:Fe-S oxidoreductase
MEVDVIESSCCGMAGAFGYAKDTADVSIKMAELDLLPAVRSATAQTLIVADGTSCRHQIAGGSEREAIHVAQVFALALNSQGATSLPSSEQAGPVRLNATGFNQSSGSNIGDVS